MESNVMERHPFRLGSQIEYETGHVVRKDLISAKGGGVSMLAFDKEVKIDVHSVPFAVMVQVVEGAFEFSIEDNLHYLKKNDAVVMPPNTLHAVKALEQGKIMLIHIND